MDAAATALGQGRSAQGDAFGELHRERLLWTRDFENLRDVALRYVEDEATQSYIEALFRDWTKEKPETTRRKKKAAQAAGGSG